MTGLATTLLDYPGHVWVAHTLPAMGVYFLGLYHFWYATKPRSGNKVSSKLERFIGAFFILPGLIFAGIHVVVVIKSLIPPSHPRGARRNLGHVLMGLLFAAAGFVKYKYASTNVEIRAKIPDLSFTLAFIGIGFGLILHVHEGAANSTAETSIHIALAWALILSATLDVATQLTHYDSRVRFLQATSLVTMAALMSLSAGDLVKFLTEKLGVEPSIMVMAATTWGIFHVAVWTLRVKRNLGHVGTGDVRQEGSHVAADDHVMLANDVEMDDLNGDL